MFTKTKPDGKWCVLGSDGKEIPWKDVPNELYGAICKLRDYEQTKLSPRAIELLCEKQAALICENSRLLAENNRLKAPVDAIEDVLKGSGNNG